MAFELDDFVGGFSALMLGDALGAPYEFKADSQRRYDGEDPLALPLRIYNRYRHDFRVGVPGQITDDSEMTMAVLRALVSDKKDYRTSLLTQFLDWANSGSMLGRNTRSLFKGVKTIRGYEGRASKSDFKSESNGTLMRALPYVFLQEKFSREKSLMDQNLSNRNEMTQKVNAAYIALVRGVKAKKVSPSKARGFVEDFGLSLEDYPLDASFRGKSKGWVVYPLVYLVECLEKYPLKTASLKKIAEEVINFHRGCDSDTVLAIVFGAYGVWLGYEKLSCYQWFRENFQKVLDADTEEEGFPRPERYWASTFFDELPEMWKKLNK